MTLTFGPVKRTPSLTRTTTTSLALLAAIALSASPAAAVNKCKATTSSQDGTIEITASNVSGNLLWGAEAGQETNQFWNELTCISSGKAKKCTLGDLGSSERITPPRNCSIFLADLVNGCEVYLKGCTPGLREETSSGGTGGGSSGGGSSGGGSGGSGGSGDLEAVPAMQNINGVEVPYTRTLTRYMVVATYDPSYPDYNTASRVVDIPQSVMLDYCADEDGCSVSMAMRNWSSGNDNAAMSVGPLRFYYHPASGRFRTATAAVSGEFGSFGEGDDNNGFFNHAMRVANCWLTDAEYDLGTNNSYDTQMGMHLLNHVSNPSYTGDCELTIDD